MTSYYKYTFVFFVFLGRNLHAQSPISFTREIAEQLSELPLACIGSEFPNKTAHLSDSAADAQLLPHELHPVFYGCLDWHSSVHGHWMLVRLLKAFPEMSNRDTIIALLNNSFQLEKMKKEAAYFGRYTASINYERTYGWAWLLKLDEELYTWKNPDAKRWHEALQPLTQKIVGLWKDYLPKATYPSRVGTHTNTAFGLCFALDWANTVGDTAFARQIKDKARYYYAQEENTPAYLEPDGADFFSPSLEVADLMSRVLQQDKLVRWINKFYSHASIERLCEPPLVSDRKDYHIVHLDGLFFSRAWCMKSIAGKLPADHPLKSRFEKNAAMYIAKALPEIMNGGYGGAHWLASFAIYALSVNEP